MLRARPGDPAVSERRSTTEATWRSRIHATSRVGSGSRESDIADTHSGSLTTGDEERHSVPAVIRAGAGRTGWVISLGVTLVAGVLRFWDLGSPHTLVSDENYYALWAWSLIHHGYVTRTGAVASHLAGAGSSLGAVGDNLSFPVHPPTGLWLIGAGEHLFGMNPIGWRVATALAGTLLVLVVVRLLLRLTHSVFLAAIGGLFLAFDGLELTMSRIGMLDIFLALFLLMGVAALVADRDWSRRRLIDRSQGEEGGSGWGPLLWWRPWRLAAGLSFGLAVSTKWSALFVIAAFGVLVVWWDAAARRRLGVRGWALRSMLVDGVPAFGYLVVVAFVVYLASWVPWLVHAHQIAPELAYPRYGGSFWGNWVNVPPQGIWDNVTYALRALWHYHQDVYRFHTVTMHGGGPGVSPAWGWPLMAGPFLMFTHHPTAAGLPACFEQADATCSVVLVGMGTPLLWWLGVLALVEGCYLMISKRDWRFTVPLLGVASTWLPWFAYGDRPIYSYYAVSMIPFTVIALVLVVERLRPSALGAARRRLAIWASAAVLAVALVAANLAWELPVLSARPVSREGFLARVPFPHWRVGDLISDSGPPAQDASTLPGSGDASH